MIATDPLQSLQRPFLGNAVQFQQPLHTVPCGIQQSQEKSLEAVKYAQQLAVGNGQQQLEQLHLLATLLGQEGGLIPQLLRKMAVAVESLEGAVREEMNLLPKVSGSREADRFYISAGVDAALRAAQEQAEAMKDEFVSVEHLFSNADLPM